MWRYDLHTSDLDRGWCQGFWLQELSVSSQFPVGTHVGTLKLPASEDIISSSCPESPKQSRKNSASVSIRNLYFMIVIKANMWTLMEQEENRNTFSYISSFDSLFLLSPYMIYLFAPYQNPIKWKVRIFTVKTFTCYLTFSKKCWLMGWVFWGVLGLYTTLHWTPIHLCSHPFCSCYIHSLSSPLLRIVPVLCVPYCKFSSNFSYDFIILRKSVPILPEKSYIIKETDNQWPLLKILPMWPADTC